MGVRWGWHLGHVARFSRLGHLWPATLSDLSGVQFGSSGGECLELLTIPDDDTPMHGELDQLAALQLGKGSADRLDCKAEIIGNVGPAHRDADVIKIGRASCRER